MPTFTVTFSTDIDSATADIIAATSEDALAEAHAIRIDDARLAGLCFEPWESCPVNEMTIFSPDGDEVARWRDDELKLRLAAPHLLAALRRAVTALNTVPRFEVSALDCDSYAVASECDAAIAAAERRTINHR